MYGQLPSLSACVIHVWIGWFIAVVIMRVMVPRILSVRRHCGGGRAVSCSMAVIAVVRKHPVIARMILSCIEKSAFICDIIDAIYIFLNLCHIIVI